MVLLIKHCGHVYACYLCINFFVVVSFGFFIVFFLFVCLLLVNNFYGFLEFNNFPCQFHKHENKDVLKKI